MPAPEYSQDRAVDREQDDVGGGDVERHAEHAFERHVERADQPLEVVAAMRQQIEPDAIEQRPGERVGDEHGRRHGQHQPDGAARGLEDDRERGRAADHIERRRVGRAIDELREVGERPAQRHQRRGDQRPVQRGDSGRAATPRRILKERQHEGGEQEA